MRRSLVLLVVGIALLTPLAVLCQEARGSASRPTVESAVYDALETSPSATTYVLIELTSPPSDLSTGELQGYAFALQESVLESVDESHFRPGYRYTSIAGLTGWAMSGSSDDFSRSPAVTSFAMARPAKNGAKIAK